MTMDLVLTSPPLALQLPPICARCGEPASERLQWERVFEESSGDDGVTHTIETAQAPFCPACLAQHEREVKRMPLWQRLLQCFRSEMMIPAVLSGGFGFWLFTKLLPRTAAQITNWVDWAVPAGVLLFFGVISLGSLWSAREATRHHTVPPLTSITISFGFRAISGELFEGKRYRYTLANPRFHEALRAANESTVWQPSGEHARSAANKRIALYIALGFAAVLALSWEWLADLQFWEW